MLFLTALSSVVSADEPSAAKLDDWEEQLERLRSTPYLSLSETASDISDTGVVFWDRGKTQNGYNFYCNRMSGESLLLDMNGRVVHRWTYLHHGGDGSYHHAIMLANGDLVVIKEYQQLLRLNWGSQLIWKKELAAHHDVVPSFDGTFYVIVQEEKHHRSMSVWFDTIVHLTADGEEIERWSTYDHLAEMEGILDTRSFLDRILDGDRERGEQGGTQRQGAEKPEAQSAQKTIQFHLDLRGGREQKKKKASNSSRKTSSRSHYDYFHMNAIDVLPATISGERDARFQMGNLLICLRNVNQIAVLEKDSYRILWAWGEGELDWPHHSTMLENGHILVFDNGIQRGYSRVVEMDPVEKVVVWKYRAQPTKDFYSKYRGSAQRLANGNTLICESDNGRVFEVTNESEVVWTWLNQTSADGHRKALYRFMRLPSDAVEQLRDRWWWWR